MAQEREHGRSRDSEASSHRGSHHERSSDSGFVSEASSRYPSGPLAPMGSSGLPLSPAQGPLPAGEPPPAPPASWSLPRTVNGVQNRRCGSSESPGVPALAPTVFPAMYRQLCLIDVHNTSQVTPPPAVPTFSCCDGFFCRAGISQTLLHRGTMTACITCTLLTGIGWH